MRRRESASIWSRDRFTEGRSGLERWEVRFLDEVNSDERTEVIAVHKKKKHCCGWTICRLEIRFNKRWTALCLVRAVQRHTGQVVLDNFYIIFEVFLTPEMNST
jgi:hypothetical protein